MENSLPWGERRTEGGRDLGSALAFFQGWGSRRMSQISSLQP